MVDGTTVSMPDTQENQQMFPQHPNQEAGVSFSLARVVVLTDMSARGLLDAAMGPCESKGIMSNRFSERCSTTSRVRMRCWGMPCSQDTFSGVSYAVVEPMVFSPSSDLVDEAPISGEARNWVRVIMW